MIRGGGATLVPPFTLYGDGTVVFRNPMVEPPPAVGPVMVQNPMRTAKLDEDQIQDLLDFALTEGGLGVAKLQYDYPMLADAGTAIFTIRAGGLDKTVNVYALGIDDPNVPDRPARAAFTKLSERLTNFDQNGTFATDVYVPSGYRGILLGHWWLPRRGARRMAVGRHHARRLRRRRGQRRAAHPGHDRRGARRARDRRRRRRVRRHDAHRPG